jgi:hypothetical protein
MVRRIELSAILNCDHARRRPLAAGGKKGKKKPADLSRLRVLTSMEAAELVPEVGIEPTWAQGPLDFESSASTSFTTPAQGCHFHPMYP